MFSVLRGFPGPFRHGRGGGICSTSAGGQSGNGGLMRGDLDVMEGT